MQRNDRSYKDLKQKQKSAIADKTYKMYLKFYLENQRMPDAIEMNDICKRLFTAVQSLSPKTEYEEFYKIVEKYFSSATATFKVWRERLDFVGFSR